MRSKNAIIDREFSKSWFEKRKQECGEYDYHSKKCAELKITEITDKLIISSDTTTQTSDTKTFTLVYVVVIIAIVLFIIVAIALIWVFFIYSKSLFFHSNEKSKNIQKNIVF
jgi:hypothetical protein